MTRYTVDILAETRFLITFEAQSKKNEKIAVEFSKCTNSGTKYSLPYLWKKNGYTDKLLETYWSVNVFATEDGGNGTCYGRYNPTTKIAENGKRMVLDFDWLLEATEENAAKLLHEVERRAFR